MRHPTDFLATDIFRSNGLTVATAPADPATGQLDTAALAAGLADGAPNQTPQTLFCVCLLLYIASPCCCSSVSTAAMLSLCCVL